MKIPEFPYKVVPFGPSCKPAKGKQCPFFHTSRKTKRSRCKLLGVHNSKELDRKEKLCNINLKEAPNE